MTVPTATYRVAAPASGTVVALGLPPLPEGPLWIYRSTVIA